MLNELFHLSESMKRADVTHQSWHRHFKECPQGGKAFFVELDDQGRVENVSPITNRSGLRKYEKAAGYSFPSFNVPPLLQLVSDQDKQRAAKLKKILGSKKPFEETECNAELKYLLSVSVSGWVRSDKNPRARDPMDKLNNCLSSVTEVLAAILGEGSSETTRSFVELIRRAKQTDGYAIHEQLKEIAINGIKSNRFKAQEWMDVLFFHSGKKPKNIAIVLELVDQSQFTYPANHQVVQAWVNDRLMEAESAEEKQKDVIAEDAFAVEGGGMNEKFPEVKIPVLGNVKLHAMSGESPCQKRYGSSGAKSFLTSRPARQNMKNALEWITKEERCGKTWSNVSSLGPTKAVLISYPSELPLDPPELAGLFGGVEEAQSDPDGSRFEACARRVTRTLKGHTASPVNAELRVFVLIKPDGFRTKVLHNSRYTVQQLLDSADEWQTFCRNSPPVMIRQFGTKKGDKPIWRTPLIPYPTEVVWCLNTAWQRMGTHAETTFGLQIVDGLSLLLAGGPVLESVVTRSLRAITSNSVSLLLAIGQAAHQGMVHPMNATYGKQALLLPSILGLLLRKLGYMKETIMKEPPYLIGKLLSLADQLHVKYCQEVRKGQVPPQLVGNALMTSAMETPKKALSLFWQRIKPYYAWAQTVQGGDNVRLVKYFLGEMGRVSTALAKMDLPNRSSETDKVAMLLGYLSRSEKLNYNSEKITNQGDQE